MEANNNNDNNNTFKIEEVRVSRCRPFYPTACCELFHASTASYLVASIQLLFSILLIILYLQLEFQGFLIWPHFFRPVIFTAALLYAGGTAAAIYGVARLQKYPIQLHTTLMTSVMIVTDVVAAGIVLMLAIGNRNDFTYNLPHSFVSEKKFYSMLGPFWMYLGAISLHITVAANMCMMQVFTSSIQYIESLETKDIEDEQKQRIEG